MKYVSLLISITRKSLQTNFYNFLSNFQPNFWPTIPQPYMKIDPILREISWRLTDIQTDKQTQMKTLSPGGINNKTYIYGGYYTGVKIWILSLSSA